MKMKNNLEKEENVGNAFEINNNNNNNKKFKKLSLTKLKEKESTRRKRVQRNRAKEGGESHIW